MQPEDQIRCLADYDAALGLDELSEGGTGGEGRIRAARLPARKSFEEFDFDHARGLTRNVIAHLGALDLSCIYLTHDYARFCAAYGDAQHVSST
jgi:hypothetical protein